MDQSTQPAFITDDTWQCGINTSGSHTSWPTLASVSSCVYETGADVVLCEWQHAANVTTVLTDWGTGGGGDLNSETQSVVCPGWRRWGSEAPEHPVLKVWAANTASWLRGIIPGAFCLFRLMTLSSVCEHHTRTHTKLNGGQCLPVPCAANYEAFRAGKRQRFSPFKYMNPSLYRLQRRWLERAARSLVGCACVRVCVCAWGITWTIKWLTNK